METFLELLFVQHLIINVYCLPSHLPCDKTWKFGSVVI